LSRRYGDGDLVGWGGSAKIQSQKSALEKKPATKKTDLKEKNSKKQKKKD